MALTAFKLWRYGGHTSTPTEDYAEAASQSFVTGAPITLNAAGYATEGGTDPTGIQGVAQADGANNSTAGVATTSVTPARDDTEFVGSVDSAASEGTGTSAQTNVGAKFGITKTSLTGQDASKWYVDTDKTAEAVQRVEVLGLIDAATTIQGRVRFKFLDV